MKNYKIFIFILVCLVFPRLQYAQELNAQELIDKILRLEPILNFKTFKIDLEAEITEISATPMSAEDYEALETAYNNIKINTDKFVGLIKQDILDFKRIKKMAKNADSFVEKYAEAFNSAAAIHADQYLPVVQKIKGKERFAILAVLAPLGKMAFDGIVNWIKNKRIDKDELMGDLLQIVNTSFVDKLKMRPWATIASPHKPLTNNNIAKKSTPASPQNNPNKINPKKTQKSNSIAQYPTTKGLSGNISFVLASGQTMQFLSNQSKSRDITIGALNSQDGAAAGVFSTTKTYPEGTQFQIETQCTGLIYAFAFNSDETTFAIYPYSADWVKGYGMSAKKRDITINPLMLKNEDDNTLIIPSPRADNGQDNYITITGKSTKEQICLLVTKSELDFENFLLQIDEAEGSLSERLEQVLGAEVQGYEQLSLQNNVFSFDLDQLEMPIMPIVFEIKR